MSDAVSPRRLRILVAANIPGGLRGGASRLMGFIGDRLVTAGHEVEYFYASAAARYGSRGRWARLAFPLALLRHVRRAHLAGTPYDIVNAHEPIGAALVRWRRAAGDPAIVVTTHGVERRAWELALEERRLGRRGPSLKTRLLYPATSLWQSALSLRGADHIFCLNEEDRRYLSLWLGPPAPPITRVFPGADGVFARAAEGRTYERADRLLFAATWRKNKGIEDLVPAVTALAEHRPHFSLTVLGGGFPAGTILSAFPAHLRDRVQCMQADSDDETAAVFASHDLFVLPSLFEGTPLTLIEAMASGLPIVTTSTCGMLDVIRDGELGLLVPIRRSDAIVQAIERLMGDGPFRQRLGEAARAEALAHYTWDDAALPVREAYERLAASRARAPSR